MYRFLEILFQRGSLRDLNGGIKQKRVLTYISLFIVLSHIYLVIIIYAEPLLIRSFHASTFIALTFLFYTPSSKGTKKINIIDFFLMTLSILTFIYILLNLQRLVFRYEFVDEVFILDKIFGSIFLFLAFEACRRILGWPIILVSIIFFLYVLFGQYLPGYFGHLGFSYERLIEIQFLTNYGLFSYVIGISATFVFMFILFGSVIRFCGGADFFFEIGKILGAATRGGAAKTAVIASALFATISGSANANVATTGTFTIPMMKKNGYRPEFAGAVEAAASCAGIITPPVMGAVAFILANFVGVAYSKVILIAALPALMYYLSLFFCIDREAIIYNLKALDKKSIPKIIPTILKGAKLIFPFSFLVYRILKGIPPTIAAFESTILIIIYSLIFTKKSRRIVINNIIMAFRETVNGIIPAAVACVIAGTICGNINLTGVGVKFSSVIMSLSHGLTLVGLFLAAILTILFGMAIPVSIAYILAVSLAGPALVEMGIPMLNAHFFVAWYAALATITPPVCITSYMAASIAKADSMRVGWIAAALAFGGFLIPFS